MCVVALVLACFVLVLLLTALFRVALMQKTLRLKRELLMLTQNPPFGITCWQEHDSIDQLKASKCVIN